MKPVIRWFASNHVVANLLMVVIVGAGILTIPTITREVFPEFQLDMITVSVPYPGASPEEVEEGVCVKIEEAVQDLDGIKRLESTASEGGGSVLIELEQGAELDKMLSDVKARVDGIATFPELTEKPVITEITNRRQVIDLAIWGDVDEKSLKAVGERVRDELLERPGITQVDLYSARPYEISVEVSEEALRRFGLTFDEVAAAIRRSSLDLPGGSIRTRSGQIMLRTKGQAYRGEEFAELTLRTFPDGSRVRLGDVARVVDGFAETDQSARFNGKPAVDIRVFRVGNEDPIRIARTVHAYAARAQARMPEGITITPWNDDARFLQGRIDLMRRNARNGYILVFIILALFLRFRLAWWVSLGIPVSFLGTFWLMPSTGVTINMLSLFAFIVVLGIVVDDAIVVGENVHEKQQAGLGGVDASTEGTTEVAMPVIYGVLTTVAAFAPLLMVPGLMGKFMRVIPIIVITTLGFSLFESLLILPAHLAGSYRRPGGGDSPPPRYAVARAWKRLQTGFTEGLDRFVEGVYRPVLELGLRWRYATIAVAVATLVLSLSIIAGGWMKFVFFPRVESDYIAADLEMPPGYAVANTAEAIAAIERAAIALRDSLAAVTPPGHESPIRHMFTSLGEQPRRMERATPGADWSSFFGGNKGEVLLELAPSESRAMSSEVIARRWREMTPEIPDAVELTFSARIFSAGAPINVQLTGLDVERLEAAARRVKRALHDYAGVFDVTDTSRRGTPEIKLHLQPAAEAWGVTLADVARQVRQAFYGEEAQRIQRGRDEVKVMVRYPVDQRRSIGDLENMRIRTPSGAEVPFTEVARAELGRGYATIRRVDRRRAVSVTADVDPSLGNAEEILADLRENVLPRILADFPDVTWSFEGEQREQRETMAGLMRGFMIALLLIYALMAIPFRSYVQPLIVMGVIPFGFVGAVWGHLIMRINLSILSMFGLVALTGVVVNDSIVLVHFVNERRREGVPLERAVRESGVRRFRPILLTSLTTFAGLLPLLMERSLQARFLVPMAVSLGFGVLFATFITLMIVPASYLVLEDLAAWKRRIRDRLAGRAPREAGAAPARDAG